VAIILAFQSVVFAALLALAVYGIASSLHTRLLEKPIPGGVTTTGTVIGVRNVPSKYAYVYAPVVRFYDPRGISYQVIGPTSSECPTVGELALVSYLPSDPENAHDLSASSGAWQWPFYTCLFILMMTLAALALVIWLVVRARRRGNGDPQHPVPAPWASQGTVP
jgi:hypothetical protein